MVEIDAFTLLILLGCSLGLTFLVVLLMFGMSSRLRRVESLLQQNASSSRSEPDHEAPSAAETSRGGAFEAFLDEEPGRRELTKSEQFSAYRKWRQEKGMNWSNS